MSDLGFSDSVTKPLKVVGAVTGALLAAGEQAFTMHNSLGYYFGTGAVGIYAAFGLAAGEMVGDGIALLRNQYRPYNPLQLPRSIKFASAIALAIALPMVDDVLTVIKYPFLTNTAGAIENKAAEGWSWLTTPATKPTNANAASTGSYWSAITDWSGWNLLPSLEDRTIKVDPKPTNGKSSPTTAPNAAPISSYWSSWSLWDYIPSLEDRKIKVPKDFTISVDGKQPVAATTSSALTRFWQSLPSLPSVEDKTVDANNPACMLDLTDPQLQAANQAVALSGPVSVASLDRTTMQQTDDHKYLRATIATRPDDGKMIWLETDDYMKKFNNPLCP